jgi:adenylosuccinate synthase
MPVSVIVGGQFGSEGKGKVSYYFAQKLGAVAVVRVGGTNSGHTVIGKNGVQHIFRILPTAAIDPGLLCILPCGSYIDTKILRSEVESIGILPERLKIDPYAVIIDPSMIEDERQSCLREKIASTLSGTGAAVIKRLHRTNGITFAKNCDELAPYIVDTKTLMRNFLDNKKQIIIEGTQGFGLSINSTYYPYCTSRDTTAAGFLMETGLSPFDVENIIMVIRAYPIRVDGNSGPLPHETNWESIKRSAGAETNITEYASATNRIRRVAKFDNEIVRMAIQVNKPNIIVLNHVDYIDYSCHNSNTISIAVKTFVKKISAEINKNIDYIGTGKDTILSFMGE